MNRQRFARCGARNKLFNSRKALPEATAASNIGRKSSVIIVFPKQQSMSPNAHALIAILGKFFIIGYPFR